MVKGVREQESRAVELHRERTSIPTQMPTEPSPYPEYLDNRVYQGMSGAVYPLPFHERISQESKPHDWDLITLRNDWVEVAMLPELGGRIAWGIDRTRDYDMFYKNQVIKPALVGLAGPWLSGGVEFNWPQHHRPATFLPTSTEVEHEDDGAITVWFSDHDPFARMKGMHGVRLRPDSAVIELRVRLNNRTDSVQTFLWWANVAARSSDHYQSFFPTDVHYVADHARRAITAFPQADRPYYGWDYPAAAKEREGADRIDWYRNIPVPTSYMCLGTADDFFGGYDHEHRAGFVHVADHHISPGKKQWTWGNSEFGWAWDRNLTEVDGPYVELMAGVYTDNQPDFAFLQPGETKTFSQYWYPFQDIGPVHQANLDAAVALNRGEDGVTIGVATTRDRRDVNITLRRGEQVVWETATEVAPGAAFATTVPVDGEAALTEFTLDVMAGEQRLITWKPREVPADPHIPDPATEPPAPEDIPSNDELFITGLHLMQYHHSTRRPEPYWEEAVRRDEGDSRCLTALGSAALRRGDLDQAREYLEAAVARLTRRNPNPSDTEARYLLGQALERLGRDDDALESYGRAAWTLAWRDASDFSMARIYARQGRYEEALSRVAGNGSQRDPRNRARCLEVVALRRLGKHDEAERVLAWLRSIDPLDVWAAHLAGEPFATDAPTQLDIALEYASVGETDQAIEILSGLTSCDVPLGQVNVAPLAHLHRAHILHAQGHSAEAEAAIVDAESADARWCFPSRQADLDALQALEQAYPGHALSHRMLGHLLYHLGRREEAMEQWQRGVELDDTDPVTRRNLAVAAHNIADDAEAAARHYHRARELAPDDAKLLYEQDQLRKRVGVSPSERLAALEQDLDLVRERDDLTVEYVELLTAAGRADEGIDIMRDREFQPWEGGEGRVLSAWEEALLAMARDRMAHGDPRSGETLLKQALELPHSLGEGRHPLANHAMLDLALGDAVAAQGKDEEARKYWQQAATFIGDFRTMATVPYSDMTYFSVQASRKLGEAALAEHLTNGLADYAEELAGTQPKVDFFATSLPSLLLFTDDLERRNAVDVAVLRGQAAELRGDFEAARARIAEALAIDPNHVRAQQLQREFVEDA